MSTDDSEHESESGSEAGSGYGTGASSGSGSGEWEAFRHEFDADRGRALLDLGESLAASGEVRQGLQAAMAAAETARGLDDLPTQARAYVQAAQRHLDLGEQLHARDAFTAAARIWGGLLAWKDQGRALLAAFDAARVAGVLAPGWTGGGDRGDCEAMLQEAYTLLLGVEDNHPAAYAAARLAQREHAAHRSESALDLLDQARSLAGDDMDLNLLITNVHADVLIDLHRYCCALPLLWQAHDLAESLNAGRHPSFEAWRIISTLRLSGDLAQAMDLAQSTLGILNQTRSTDADAYGCIHLEIARIALARGDRAGARVHARKARHHQMLANNPEVMAACEEIWRELGDAGRRGHDHVNANGHVPAPGQDAIGADASIPEAPDTNAPQATTQATGKRKK